MFSHAVSLSLAAAAVEHFFLTICSNSLSSSLLPWWFIKSEIHWYWLLKVVLYAVNSRGRQSELIKHIQIRCSETANSEFLISEQINSDISIRHRICWTLCETSARMWTWFCQLVWCGLLACVLILYLCAWLFVLFNKQLKVHRWMWLTLTTCEGITASFSPHSSSAHEKLIT